MAYMEHSLYEQDSALYNFNHSFTLYFLSQLSNIFYIT